MTESELKEVLASCYWRGFQDARNVDRRYDTPEDMQRRAEAVVAEVAREAMPGPAYAPPGGAVSTILARLRDQKD